MTFHAVTAPFTETSFGPFNDAAAVGRKEEIVPWLTEAALGFSMELSDCTGNTAALISKTDGEERFCLLTVEASVLHRETKFSSLLPRRQLSFQTLQTNILFVSFFWSTHGKFLIFFFQSQDFFNLADIFPISLSFRTYHQRSPSGYC